MRCRDSLSRARPVRLFSDAALYQAARSAPTTVRTVSHFPAVDRFLVLPLQLMCLNSLTLSVCSQLWLFRQLQLAVDRSHRQKCPGEIPEASAGRRAAPDLLPGMGEPVPTARIFGVAPFFKDTGEFRLVPPYDTTRAHSALVNYKLNGTIFMRSCCMTVLRAFIRGLQTQDVPEVEDIFYNLP